MNLKLAPLLLLAFTPACSITFGGYGEKVVKDSELHFEPSAGTDTLRIESYNGSITLFADSTATSLEGEATTHARGRTVEHARERLAKMEWQFSQVGNTVVLRLTEPTGGSNNAGSKITRLAVPSGWDLDLDTSNGGVVVPAGFGNVKIDTGNGAVEVAGDGKIYVDTSNGSVRYSGGSQDFELLSSNGSITIELDGDWDGHGRADSSNGKIVVRCNGLIDARLEARTRNGKPRVYGPDLDDHSGKGSLDLDTSNGNISVTHAFAD